MQSQHYAGCVVVYDDGRFSSESFQEWRQVGVALAAAARREVVFEIRVAACGRKFRQGCAAQIGVKHYSGRVDHAVKRGYRELSECCSRGGGGIAGIVVVLNSRAGLV